MKIDYKITHVSDEGGKTPVFLSHARLDPEWRATAETLRAHGLPCRSDLNLNPGDPDFSVVIKNMIRDAQVVIFLLYEGGLTPWMAYELGYAEGMGKKIFLYGQKSEEKRFIYHKYGPVYSDPARLASDVSSSLLYSDILEYETPGLSKSDFRTACIDKTEIIRVSLPLPGIRGIPRTAYRFGYILLTMGRYEKRPSARKCDICNMKGEPLGESGCYKDGTGCSLVREQLYDSPVCVILNKIIFNCSVDDVHGSEHLTVTLPFHRRRGVTFKCFVDLDNTDYTEEMLPILENAGLADIGVSYSANGNRIYFLLPPNARKGLFMVEAPDGPKNNYICKGAV